MNRKSWVYIAAAIWILVAAMVNFSREGNLWVNVTAGLAVWVTAYFDIYRAGDTGWKKRYGSLGALAVGTWLAITGFFPAFAGNFSLFLMNNALMALLLAYIGSVTMEEIDDPSHQKAGERSPADNVARVGSRH